MWLKGLFGGPYSDSRAAESLAGKTVMVIDSSGTIRKVVGLVLEPLGCNVIPLKDSAEAFASLASVRPDFVLVSAMLEGPSGYEVCQNIKAGAGSPAPVVILMKEPFRRVDVTFRPSWDAVLAKPFEPNQLVKLLANTASKGTTNW